MKVHLLFAPTDGGTHPRTLPLGQATLTAFLRANGVAVDQDDVDALVWRDNRTSARTLHVNLLLLGDRGRVLPYLDGHPDPYLDTLVERMARKVDVRGADLIGLSVMEPDQVLPALCLARHLKETTDATMILGGPNVGEETLAQASFVDFVVMDEAEIPMLGLLEHLEGTRSVEDVSGLVYREADGAVQCNVRAHLPIDEIPVPDFNGLPMDVYTLDVDGATVLPLPYQLVKGCPSQCTFCNYYTYNLDGLRAKGMDKVVSELAQLSDTYSSRHFLFLDNTFNISKRYVRDWCDAVVRDGLDILWMDSARPTGLDRSLLDRLRASGCVRLTYGVETGSPRLLKLM
ncbi:MAG: radical SAM protein, partial [Methanopyri archaeon]|nr:radical SAM protein [Methanopyri archaeon]